MPNRLVWFVKKNLHILNNLLKKRYSENKTISFLYFGSVVSEKIYPLQKGIEELGTKWQIRDDQTGKRMLTDKLEIVIIEIPKAKRVYAKDINNEISQWMLFMDNPNEKEVEKIMKKNKDIKKALDELEQVSGDEKIRRIAELREKARMDEQAALSYATRHGIEEGVKERKI